jgi:hypothetical protein
MIIRQYPSTTKTNGEHCVIRAEGTESVIKSPKHVIKGLTTRNTYELSLNGDMEQIQNLLRKSNR